MSDQQLGTVVIGGSQAGLAVGYHLKQRGLPFVILDDNERIGDAWRKRWDSLHLFTPGRYNNLPGMPFPGPPSSYPSKDEIADYLEAYARAFDLPVRTAVKVDRLSKVGDRFEVICGKDTLFAENVVVATGASSNPRIPEFARELDERIVQLHSKEYRNPSQIQEGGVLVVGAGNSGAEIAIELAPHHRTWLSGPRHGAGAHRGGRESSRSNAHALHVVHGDAGIDGEQFHRQKGSRPLSRPASRDPSGPRATERLCRCGRRASAASDGGEKRISRPRGWKGPRGGERHLVYWLRTRSRLDRSLAPVPQRHAHSRSGHRRILSGALLHRASLPLLAEFVAGGRCGTRCRAYRSPHRLHAGGRP